MTAGKRRGSRYFVASFIACAAMLFCFLAAGLSSGDDWPRWRGVDHDNRSTETDLLQSWPEGGPPKLWVNTDAGLGYAGVAIVGDHLYTMGLYDDNECALCLNADTGEELWRQELGPRFDNRWGDGPRSTPTVDEERVYFMSANGFLNCFERESGQNQWMQKMEDFGGYVPMWGYAESPLVDGDKVIVTPGGDQGMVLALNKMTGEKIWQSEVLTAPNRRGEQETATAHYSSVTPAVINGTPQYVQLVPGALIGLSPEDGSTLWKLDWASAVPAVIPSPFVYDDIVFATTGYGVGSLAASFEDGEPTEIWRNKVFKNKHDGYVIKDGFVYGASESGGFMCQNLADGEMAWNDREIAKGSVTWADDRFYYIEEQGGRVLLLEANEEGGAIRGEFQLDPQSRQRASQGAIWMHPVIADGKLYLRDQELLHCYEIRDPSEAKTEESK